jgi:hypothetical protein
MHLISHLKTKALIILTLFAVSFSVNAQAPNLLNYQGVARNSVGNPLPNQAMNLRLSVHNLSAAGTVVYSETRVIKTNLGGLFSVQVGSAGTSSASGTIGGVSWLSGDKYLQVEIDPASNNNYLNLGTVQLVSVPYAFNAVTAANALTVTTNANLTGAVTSNGNLTSLAASPALTGVPTAPTAAPGTNTTQIATTEFVKAAALTGPTGAKGVQGLTGADGAAGAQGIQGLTGAAGTAGAAGAQGIQGLTGANGAAGAAGAQGIQGLAGSNGAAGAAGAQGIQGLAGAAGAQGIQGIQGLTGSVANVAAISGTSTANGASITSGALSLAPADATNGGIVTNGTQTFAGAKTFNATITGSINGNATTATTATTAGTATAATKLATARNINGVAFDGSGDITVTADAGTLTGTTINSTLTGSSLTSVGTITSGVWSGTAVAVQKGGTGLSSPGAAGQVLTTTGAGTLSWTTVSAAGGVTTVGSVSSSSNVNGATISGTSITLTPADAANGGIVTTGVQTIAGAKTFSGNTVVTGTLAGNATGTSTLAGFSANVNTQANTVTTYTLSAADNGKIITLDNAGAITLTVPSLFAGFNCMIVQLGVGQITLTAGSGVTISNRTSLTKTAGKYAIATLIGLTSSLFISAGDMQ